VAIVTRAAPSRLPGERRAVAIVARAGLSRVPARSAVVRGEACSAPRAA